MDSQILQIVKNNRATERCFRQLMNANYPGYFIYRMWVAEMLCVLLGTVVYQGKKVETASPCGET